ncbi:hypothetical protein RIR_jg12105.t2 [Rhizophagus irregularis DAOM 181602=DAOM 197198]|nr:hypothetical protein RIR_jg12105.t2 [Rhizophagus irregularis DAOM 181602=DAOM 197198]
MSNLEGSCEVEMDLIVLTPELGDITDIQKTDEEVSLNSEKKSNSPNLPPVRAPSLVWQYYEKVIDDKGVVLHVKCNFCDQKYSAKTSTGTLNDHFKRKHSKIQPKGVGSIEAAFNNSQTRTTLPGKNHLDILDNLINWVIMECQAFRVVDSPSFKELITSLNPEFQVPSRQTVHKKIDNKYAQNKKIIIKMFQENDSRISFTSDMWTLDTGAPYMGGQQIQEVTLKIFEDFSIAIKASTITIDNGANQVAAMKLLSTALETNLQVDFNVIRCGAHTIALVVNSGLKSFQRVIDKVRAFVVEIRRSPKKEEVLFSLAQKLQVKYRKLIRDVKTRWNSTYSMLESFLANKVIITSAISLHNNFGNLNLTDDDNVRF